MRTFIVYSVITWGIPALFVLTFSLLDRYGLFLVNYGSLGFCWLGTTQSEVFLFLLPLGALLSFNLVLFLFIAVSLCRNRKSNAQVLAHNVQRSRDKENILIFVKLSSLMGFSWLFLFLYIITEAETDAFLYFSEIFVSLQGVFICFAFLFNRKCFELYRKEMRQRAEGHDNCSRNADPRKANVSQQDTKL